MQTQDSEVAAPTHIFASRNPTLYVERMITLYQEGYFPYKKTNMWGDENDAKLTAPDYLRDVEINNEGFVPEASDASHTLSAIDYMLLGTIRTELNPKNRCEPGVSIKACGTWPQDIAAIMDVFELKLTKNRYLALTEEGKSEYDDINTAIKAGKGVFILQNGTIRDSEPSKKGDGSITGRFGIHYIVLKSFKMKYDANGNVERISGTYWDYGQTDRSKFKSFDVSSEEFNSATKGIFITEK